jgi:hypothetical protein
LSGKEDMKREQIEWQTIGKRPTGRHGKEIQNRILVSPKVINNRRSRYAV